MNIIDIVDVHSEGVDFLMIFQFNATSSMIWRELQRPVIRAFVSGQ